jgi:hypothetical protein
LSDGLRAADALTRFTDLDRQFPDRFFGILSSNPTGDDFSFRGIDLLTGLGITAFVSADGSSNFTTSSDISPKLSDIFPSMSYDTLVPQPPAPVDPFGFESPQPFQVPEDDSRLETIAFFESNFDFLNLGFEPQNLLPEGFGFSYGSGSDFDFSFNFNFGGVGGGSDSFYERDEEYYGFTEAIY